MSISHSCSDLVLIDRQQPVTTFRNLSRLIASKDVGRRLVQKMALSSAGIRDSFEQKNLRGFNMFPPSEKRP